MIESANLDIQPLTPARFDDLAALFEEGGDPRVLVHLLPMAPG